MVSNRRVGATVPEPEQLRRCTLPRSVEWLVEQYDMVWGCRDRYLWGWLDALLPQFKLSCVPSHYRELADEGRLLVSLYITALNDLSDRRSDPTAFEAATQIPTQGPPESGSPADEPAVRLAASAWTTILDRLADAPNFELYLPALQRDLTITAHAQRHSARVATNPGEADYEECLTRQSPTMCMDALATVDVMCSPDFDPTDEPELREVIRVIEPLGRIGNWLTTWERELAEGDIANGVVARAVEEGIVSPPDVTRARTDPEFRPVFGERIREAGVEQAIDRDRERRYRRASDRVWKADSVNLDAYVSAMATVWNFHEASHGYK